MQSSKCHPDAPGQLVKLHTNSGFNGGLYGFINGPKLELHSRYTAWRWMPGELGTVISIGRASEGSGDVSYHWCYVLVTGKGFGWFSTHHVMLASYRPRFEAQGEDDGR